jgi:hypothetical protein
MRDQPCRKTLLPATETSPQEPMMSHQPDLVQAIANQRQAESVAAAAQYRLVRAARVAAGTRGSEPDRLPGRGRRPVRDLVGRFRRWHARNPGDARVTGLLQSPRP